MERMDNMVSHPLTCSDFPLGCPWGQRPIKKWEANSFYVKKDNMADRTPTRLCKSHCLFSGANFCKEGRVISGRLFNRFGSWFGRTQNYCVNLLALYLRSVNDYLNAVFVMLLACVGAVETMPSHRPYRKSFNLLQFSPCVWKVFSYKKEICS